MAAILAQHPSISSSQRQDTNEISRLERWLAFAALAVALVLRVIYAWHFRIDSDETQHLHVVWEWTQGRLPYRDFFDNHMPLFQAICAPLFHLMGVRASILAPMRVAMIPIFALTILCVWRIARSFVDSRSALWTAVFTALFPPFYLSSIEFRPDELWTLIWLGILTAPALGNYTPRRIFSIGLLLGLAFCVSMKSSLFAVALLLAWASASGMRKLLRRQSPGISFCLRCSGAFLCGLIILPALVVGCFVALHAGGPMLYCVIKHNVVSGQHGGVEVAKRSFHWLRWIPVIALGAWIISRRAVAREACIRQAFVYFAACFYFITLVSFWPILTDEDFLPWYPALMTFAAPAALWVLTVAARKLHISSAIIPAVIAVAELIAIVHMENPLEDKTIDRTQLIANVLRLTNPDQFVMDGKGETIYRERPYYYVLEGLTKHRLKQGLLQDDIAESLLESRTPVVVNRRLPKGARDFVVANYVPITWRLYALGKVVCENTLKHASATRFSLEIPARYSLVTAAGLAKGLLDGQPNISARELSAGMHEFSPAEPQGRLVLVWAQALDRGFSPFLPIKPDVTTEQD